MQILSIFKFCKLLSTICKIPYKNYSNFNKTSKKQQAKQTNSLFIFNKNTILIFRKFITIFTQMFILIYFNSKNYICIKIDISRFAIAIILLQLIYLIEKID